MYMNKYWYFDSKIEWTTTIHDPMIYINENWVKDKMDKFFKDSTVITEKKYQSGSTYRQQKIFCEYHTAADQGCNRKSQQGALQLFCVYQH